MNGNRPEWPPATPGLTTFLDVAEGRDAKWFLKTYWKWIALSGIAGSMLGLVWIYFFPPQYVSKATLRFLPPQVAGRFVNPNFSMEVGQRMFALSQLLGSRLTASRMIESYSLYPERRRFQTVEDLTRKFNADLQVTQVGNNSGDEHKAVPTLQIVYAYPDAEKAQKVVQKLIEQVYEENRKYRGDQSLGTTEFLEEQVGAAEERVLETEQRLGQIQDAIGLTLSQAKLGQNTSRSYVIDSRLRDLRHDRRLQEERKATRKAEWEQLELVQRRIETRPVEFYIPEFEGMQHYWHLRELVTAARSRLERLKERYAPGMPDVVSAENDVKEYEAAIDRFHKERGARLRNRDLEANAAKIALAKLEMQALDKEAAEQMREESELRAESQKLREQQASPPGQETELLIAKREYDTAKEQHGQLVKKHEESRAASEMERRGQGETVEMLEPASLPTESERPNWWMRLATASLIGMGLAIGFCLLAVLRNPTVLHEGHVENWSGMPVLANLAGGATKRRGAAVACVAALMILSGCGPWNETAASLTQRGQAAERDGKPALALLHYRQAVQKDARFGAAYEGIARLCLRSGELESARDALARAVELSPDRHALVKQLAETSYQIYFDDPGRPTALLREIEALGERLRAHWPVLPDGYRILAQVLIERHRTDEAIALLEKASANVNRNESLRAQLAAVLFRTGEPDKAEAVLEDLIETAPGYLDAYDLLYLQRMQRRNSDAAREVLASKWEHSSELEAALQLAAHDDAHGRRKDAKELLESVKHVAESKPMGVARIGDFWLERAQWDLARSAYEYGRDHDAGRAADYICRMAEWHLAQGQKIEARNLIEREHKKQHGGLLLDAYLAAVRLGEVPTERRLEERKRLESILQRMPDSPFVRYHLGRAYLLERNLQTAADQFERAVRLDANYAPGWLALAEVEMRRGNAVTAELRAETVLRRNPGNATALMLQARAQAQRGKFAEAEKSLAGVIEKQPGNADAQFLMAVAAARQGRPDEASRMLVEGAKSHGDEVRWPMAHAAVLSSQGRGLEAQQLLERTIAKAGQKAELLEQLAGLQIDLKDGAGAEKTFAALAGQNTKNFEYQLGHAGAKALAGDRDAALQMYALLQKQRPADVRVWLQPAALLGEMNRTDEARHAYDEALKVSPNHPQALNNLAWLLLEKGQDERRALELAQRAKQAIRQSPEVDGTLAQAYSRLAMHRSATAVYEEMLSYVPKTDWPRLEKLLAESRKRQRKEGTS